MSSSSAEIHPFRVLREEPNFAISLEKLKAKLGPAGLAEVIKYDCESTEMRKLRIQLPHYFARTVRDLETISYAYMNRHREQLRFLSFWEGARQIFSFSPGLSAALSNTSIEDIPWAELRMPHRHFYVAFGNFGQPTYTMGGLEYIVDGAYVREAPANSRSNPEGSLVIDFTTRLLRADSANAKVKVGHDDFCRFLLEPVYEYILIPDAGGTVGGAMARGEAEYVTRLREEDAEYLKMSMELARRHDIPLPRIPESANCEFRNFESGKAHFLPLLPTLFNCILYLTSFPANISSDYSSDAPQGIVASLKVARRGNVRAELTRTLKSRGFSVVKFVKDPAFSDNPQGADQIAHGHGSTKRTHWRRGHWRRQGFGPGLIEHRIIWIRPVLVGASETGTDELARPESGTIHQVSQPD